MTAILALLGVALIGWYARSFYAATVECERSATNAAERQKLVPYLPGSLCAHGVAVRWAWAGSVCGCAP
jgi:hypothetical protein